MILQTSQAQWVMGANDNCWKISDVDNNILLVFPNSTTAKEANEVRHFAMKYEQLAFEEGKKAGGDAMLAANHQRMREMSNEILLLRHMNEELANKMSRFFENDDDE